MKIKVKIISLFLVLISLVWSENCCEAEDIATENCGGLGCYIPQCIENITGACEWEAMQCWSSTGYCWCVDENGVEIEGTSTPSWQGLPGCEEEYILGDINQDALVNVVDVVALVSIILNNSSEYVEAGDMNLDEELNVIDVVAIVSLIINPEEEGLPEECYLEPDPGPCFGYMPMYYFNQDTQTCEIFVYGGCAGVVPFQSLTECQNTCE